MLNSFRRGAATDPLMTARGLAALPPWAPPAIMAAVLLWTAVAHAQDLYGMGDAFEAL